MKTLGVWKEYFLPALCVCLLSIPCAWGDTLELKDGRLIRGKYLGGTEAEVNFLADGTVRHYPTADVLRLSFAGDDASKPARRELEGRAQTASTEGPSSRKVTAPAGTRLLVRMIDSVDSDRNRVGDVFRASLEEDLFTDGRLVAPRHTEVYGRLAEVREAGRLAGRSELRLELTGIRINGQVQTLLTGDYEVSGKSRGAGTAKKAAGGAALGAVVGAIAGGGKGAAIGAGVGGAAGTTVQVLTKGEKVRVPSETVLEFTLHEPVTLSVSEPLVR